MSASCAPVSKSIGMVSHSAMPKPCATPALCESLPTEKSFATPVRSAVPTDAGLGTPALDAVCSPCVDARAPTSRARSVVEHDACATRKAPGLTRRLSSPSSSSRSKVMTNVGDGVESCMLEPSLVVPVGEAYVMARRSARGLSSTSRARAPTAPGRSPSCVVWCGVT